MVSLTHKLCLVYVLEPSVYVCLLFFFFFFLEPGVLFMRHEQCIKANEQCIVHVNSSRNIFFLLFLVFSKISNI